MKLATLELPDKAAVANLIEKYDHPMMPVLRAAAEGQQVVDIHEVFAAGGLNKQGLPRLAFSDTTTARYDAINGWHQFGLASMTDLRIPYKRLPLWSLKWKVFFASNYMRAECPPIPKNVSTKTQIGDLYCWEVDKWAALAKPQLTDPVLLRPINDRYYIVVAQWDLTPLERELFAAVLPE